MSGAALWLAAGAAESSQHDADLAIGAAAPASAASAAEPSDNLLLRRADLTGLRQRKPDLLRQLHEQARGFLNAKILAFSPHQEGRVQSQPVDTNDWPTWKEYVASHAAAETIIETLVHGSPNNNRWVNWRVWKMTLHFWLNILALR